MAAQSTALNPTSLPFYPTVEFRTEGDQIRNRIKDEPSSLTPHVSNAQQRRDSTFTTYTSLSYQSIKLPPAPSDTLDSAHLNTKESPRPRSVTKEDSFNSGDFPLETHSIRSSANSMSTGTASDLGSISDFEVVSGGGDNKPLRINKESGVSFTLIDSEVNTTSGTIPSSQPISILRTMHRTPQQEPPGYVPPSNPYIPHKATPSNLILASSPASSAGDSSARASTGIEYIYNIDAQLKASPFINEILDRLSRYELSNREIQRELGDVRRKLDILIARSIDTTMKSPERASISAEPVFRNPFAPAGQIISISPNSSAPITSSNGGTPGSTPPVRPQDEVAQISQRLNTLTAAVSQMLALQTQQHIQSISSGLPPQGIPNNPPEQPGPQPSLSSGPTAPLPLPNRPDLRPPGRSPSLPMRTWSAGSLELPPRTQDQNTNNSVGLGRPTDSYLRDKRRSTVNIMRRDSSMVCLYSKVIPYYLHDMP